MTNPSPHRSPTRRQTRNLLLPLTRKLRRRHLRHRTSQINLFTRVLPDLHSNRHRLTHVSKQIHTLRRPHLSRPQRRPQHNHTLRLNRLHGLHRNRQQIIPSRPRRPSLMRKRTRPNLRGTTNITSPILNSQNRLVHRTLSRRKKRPNVTERELRYVQTGRGYYGVRLVRMAKSYDSVLEEKHLQRYPRKKASYPSRVQPKPEILTHLRGEKTESQPTT